MISIPADAVQVHICTTADTEPTILNLLGVSGVRDAVMSIWSTVQVAVALHKTSPRDEKPRMWTYLTLRSWVRYGTEVWPRKRRTPMDVEKLVVAWVPIVRGLSTAHSKDEIDRCEFEAETHLAPLLTAPVKQLREFYAQLCTALRTDPTIPMFVWTAFDAWHEAVVKIAPDEHVRELKVALATEVAELVEKDVMPDIKEALIGALKWRGAEALTEVRDAVKSGAKPRVRGRESCLFLQVPRNDGTMVSVML
jgi:hypothetical protein